MTSLRPTFYVYDSTTQRYMAPDYGHESDMDKPSSFHNDDEIISLLKNYNQWNPKRNRCTQFQFPAIMALAIGVAAVAALAMYGNAISFIATHQTLPKSLFIKAFSFTSIPTFFVTYFCKRPLHEDYAQRIASYVQENGWSGFHQVKAPEPGLPCIPITGPANIALSASDFV